MSLKKCEGCGRPMGIFALIGEGKKCRSCRDIEEFAGRIGQLLVAAIAEVKQGQKPARYIPKAGDMFTCTNSKWSASNFKYKAVFADSEVILAVYEKQYDNDLGYRVLPVGHCDFIPVEVSV
jgi:hypothetical protein